MKCEGLREGEEKEGNIKRKINLTKVKIDKLNTELTEEGLVIMLMNQRTNVGRKATC
jgi:hypothetical protein